MPIKCIFYLPTLCCLAAQNDKEMLKFEKNLKLPIDRI